MDLLFVPLLAVCLWGFHFCREGFREDYLSVENTRAFRGILAVLVALHHMYMYMEKDGGILYLLFSNFGVPCVVLFLFLSGYGLQKSFAGKEGYGRKILTRRIPALLYPFLLLIPVYWGLYAAMGSPYTVMQTLQSLINGSPIVRYGWYTQCQILLYLLYFFCTLLFEKHRNWMPWGVLGMTVLLVLGMVMAGLPPFWYYSIAAFPCGVFWAVWEKPCLAKLQKRYWLWLMVSLVVFGGFFALGLKTFRTGFYWAADCALILFVLLVLRKFTFRNQVLDFLGGLSFEIYSLHGFFMMLYRSRIVWISSDLLCACAVFASTIPAAWLLNRLMRGK